MSTAAALLWGYVSGILAFVIYRRQASRTLALYLAVMAGTCGYIGFRLGCAFHL